jgi:hypothetical protein
VGPAQAERGRLLFFDASNDLRCAVCHSLGAAGSSIAGDLDQFGSRTTRQIAAAIRTAPSDRVVSARLKDGDTFPALRLDETGDHVKLYDLTVPPPVLRSLERVEIESISSGSSWSHGKVTARFTAPQLADIIAYIRWTASGKHEEIKPSDLE